MPGAFRGLNSLRALKHSSTAIRPSQNFCSSSFNGVIFSGLKKADSLNPFPRLCLSFGKDFRRIVFFLQYFEFIICEHIFNNF